MPLLNPPPPYTRETFQAATAHLAKWEKQRPLPDRGLFAWGCEQHKHYSAPHPHDPNLDDKPSRATTMWMSRMGRRLATAPTPDEGDAELPPQDAIVAWMENQRKINVAKGVREANERAAEMELRQARLAKKSEPAPRALQGLPLFRNGGEVEKTAAPAVCAHFKPVETWSGDGSLDFERGMPKDHQRERCAKCKRFSELWDGVDEASSSPDTLVGGK